MLIVRGTKKLRDRVKAPLVSPDERSTTVLGDWFATALFWKPHLAMLVNERTFLPVFMPLAPAATLLDRVPEAIASVLSLHGVDEAFIAGEVAAMTDVRLGPTNNRSVVGVMNEFAFHGEFHWKDGLDDMHALSIRMARLILGPLRGEASSPDRALAVITGSSPPSIPARHLRAVPSSQSTSGSIYQLKITLLDTKPPIWRRVLVDGHVTLDRLHEIIQAAFGWWNYHLHEFEIGRTRYGTPQLDADWDPPKDDRRTRLDAVAKEGSKFRYVYDFGDNWTHQIVVEKVVPEDPSVTVPACIDGRRACPPEDCGGTWGYDELLAILADTKHEEHAERLEWAGGPIDPEAFDRSEFESNLATSKLAHFDD